MHRLYVYASVIALYIPILFIALFSFHQSPSLTLPFEGFSLRWYQQLLTDEALLTAFKNSLIVGSATALSTAVIGSMAAISFLRLQGAPRRIFGLLAFMPISLPGLFVGVALLIAFSEAGLQRSLVTVTIAHVFVTVPLFIEMSRARLEYYDRSVEEAARDLGATPLQVFRLVTFPIIAPTLLGSTILAFAISLDEVIVTIFVSGTSSTLPLHILSMLRRTATPLINAASVLIISTVVLTLLFASVALYVRKLIVTSNRARR